MGEEGLIELYLEFGKAYLLGFGHTLLTKYDLILQFFEDFWSL